MRLMIVSMLLLTAFSSFAGSISCKSFYNPVILNAERILEVKAFFSAKNGFPAETVAFVNSELFSKMALAPDVAKIATYIVNNGPKNYVKLQDGWHREIPKHEEGYQSMPPLRSDNGELRGGYQINGNEMIVVLKSIVAIAPGQKKLVDGQVGPPGSRYFLNVIMGGLVALSHLAKTHPEISSMLVTTIASVNGNIKNSLQGRLGFSSHPTIPKDEASAHIDDLKEALARGVDPSKLNVIPPTDFYLRINLDPK